VVAVWAILEAAPNPVHLLYGAQGGTFDLEWSGQSDVSRTRSR
jgi:hypothetical protein